MGRAIKEAIYIESTTLPLIEILASTICPTSGTSSVFHLRIKNQINDLSTITSVL